MNNLSSMATTLTQQLIRIESTDPGNYETAVYEYIRNWLTENVPSALLTHREVLPGRFNLMAQLSGDPTEPAMVFICHMDTVVVGDGWSLPPFDGLEQDGKIYGRGACDMKSGLACALSAFYHASQLNERYRRLVLICTVDEEDFMRGAEAVIADGWITREDWIMDMEPTDGAIRVAHKGRTWFEITVQGVTAHASTPWEGADAIAAMAEIISSLRKDIAAAPIHPELGRSTVTFGQIEGGYRPYVVPDLCKLWVDLRLVPPTDTSAAIFMVERATQHAILQIPGVKVSYEITGDRPYIEKDETSPLLHKLKEICLAMTGKDADTAPFPGYTDTAVIAGKLGNRSSLSYGPGSLAQAHKPDEWVTVADIRRCEKVLWALVEDL